MNKPQSAGPDAWRQIIDGQQPSGLTVVAYCLEWGITQGSFYTWKRRLRLPRKLNHVSGIKFVEVTPSKTSVPGAIEICLHGERHLLKAFGLGIIVR
jgi:hypothetical protein